MKQFLKWKPIGFMVFLLAAAFSFSIHVDAAVPKKVQVVTKDTIVSSDYSFIAQFNKKKTQVTTFGLKTTETRSTPDGGFYYYSFNPLNKSSLKGKFGVKYTSIGMYQGKEVDLKITVLDWDYYLNNDTGKISFNQNDIAGAIQGYNFVDLKWEFLEHGTNKLMQVQGFMTFNDIDSTQFLEISKETNDLTSSYLVDASALDWLTFTSKNGALKIGEDNGSLSENEDLFAMFTMLINKTDTLHFKWGRDLEKAGSSPNRVYDPLVGGGEYFGYLAKKPARTEMLTPTKSIEVNGQEGDSLNIYSNEPFAFNLYHPVPDEYPEYYYDNYSITDTIDSRLSIQSITVLDQEDKDVTSYFDNQTSGNSVKLVAKTSYIKKSTFYNNTYKVVVTVKVKDSSSLSSAAKDGKVTFTNTFSVTTNNTTKKSNQVTGMLNQRKIDVWHLDKKTESTLEHTTAQLFDGDSYSYSSKTGFKKGEYSYTPAPKETKQGVVEGKDVELKFYYQLPMVEVNVQHIQIYTDNAKRGLPVKVQLAKMFPNGTSGLANKKIQIQVFEKGSDQALLTKEYAINQIPTAINDWVIPKTNLVKDTHKNYVVKISGLDEEVISNHPEIDTDGYTASEKALAADPKTSSKITYKGVVMTEREIGKDMETHYESLEVPLTKLPKQKTGYGFELKTNVSYQNDLAKVEDIRLESLMDKKLIDSYLEYPAVGNDKVVPLEPTGRVTSSDQKSTSYVFELPHVNVEQKTGYLFSDQQRAAKDPRIKYSLKDGMRKQYVPIWTDLGSYKVAVKSAAPIGANEVTLQVNDQLQLFAFMYGTIDSDTLKEDEILIEPVDPQDPFPDGLPKGWTENDLNWFKNE